MVGLRSGVNILRELGPPFVFGLVSFGVLHYLEPWFSFLVSFIVFWLLYVYYKSIKPHIELKNVMGSVLTGTFPAIPAIAVAILFIIYTSWLAELIGTKIGLLGLGGIKNGAYNTLFGALTLIVLIFSLPFVFVLSITETPHGSSTKKEKKRVFIGALSELRAIGSADREKEFNRLLEVVSGKEHNLDEELKRVSLNWAPLLRAIFFHVPSLEKVYLLVSPESGKYRKHIEEILNRYMDNKEKRFGIKFTNPVDFNNYDEIHSELRKIIKEIKKEDYTDGDISVYISGGTSAVTLALTLLAVKDGRQVEYVLQSKDAEIVSINIGIEDIFSFAPELKGVSGS